MLRGIESFPMPRPAMPEFWGVGREGGGRRGSEGAPVWMPLAPLLLVPPPPRCRPHRLAVAHFLPNPFVPIAGGLPLAAREVKKELALVASSAYSSLKGLFFSNFSAILEGPPSLWPSLAAMGGATVLVPTDYAWAHPQWLLTAALVKGALKGPSFRRWLRNVALFHVLRIFKSSIDWTVRMPPVL